MSIQLVYNWRHRLVGRKKTYDRERSTVPVVDLVECFPFNSHRCEEDSNII